MTKQAYFVSITCVWMVVAPVAVGNPVDTADLVDQVVVYRDTWGVPHIFGETEDAAFFGNGYVQAEENILDLARSVRRAQGRMAEAFGESGLQTDYLARLLRVHEFAERKYDEIPADARRAVENFARGVNYYISTHRRELPEWVEPVTAVDLVASFRSIGTPPGSVRQEASNSWVLAPNRTVSGNTTLVADPHNPWFQRCEVHIKGGDLNVAGCVMNNLVWIGHNERVAWGGSANFPDLEDIYEEKLNPENHHQYLYEGEWRDMTVRKVTITVKMGDGPKEVERELLYTHHGPVFRIDEKRDRAYSWRTGLYDTVGMIGTHYRMAKADSIAQLKGAMSSLDMTAAPNVVAGDKDGNIFYIHYGKIPLRSQKYDWSKPVPGWTKETEWQGFVPFEKLAQVENPECGFLQTSNEAPWFVCPDSGLSRGQFSTYEVRGSTWTWRGKRLTQLLTSKPKFTLDEIKAFAMDTYVLIAEQWKAAILSGYAERRNQGGTISEQVVRAVEILRQWDNRSTKDSSGVTLFEVFYLKLEKRLKPYLEVDVAQMGTIAFEVFEEAVQQMIDWYGTIEKPWGEVHLLKRGDRTYPMGAAETNLRTVYLAGSNGPDKRGTYFCDHGSSYTFVCELGDPLRAFSIKPFGQSGDPTSPHFADQTELFGQDEFKPFWFSEKDVLEHAESAWGTRIRLGTRMIGYEAQVTARAPLTVIPACTSENPGPPLPEGMRPVSRFLRLDSKQPTEARVSVRLYARATGVPHAALRTAALYVAEPDCEWQRCQTSRIDRATQSVVGTDMVLGTFVVLVHGSVHGSWLN